MTSENPYSTPVAEPSPEVVSSSEAVPLGTIARATFLAWEKLRLIYIAVLGAMTMLIGLTDWRVFSSLEFWMIVVEGAIVTNVCFFAGPIIETYVSWLGFRANWLRMGMFVLGTLLSCVVALGVIATQLLPNM